MLNDTEARRFSDSWYAAWNRHDLDAIMSHYAESIEHSSPFIARYNDDPECRPLRGKVLVRDYFGRALQRNPTLRFDAMHLAVGVQTVALVYRRMTGEMAVETFRLRDGLVEASVSHYGL